jgi:hypothetical protein
MHDGGLLNGVALIKDVEAVYRALWAEWCAERQECTDGDFADSTGRRNGLVMPR